MSTKPTLNKTKQTSPSNETPAAEVLTTVWALAVMTTFMCDLGSAVTRLLVTIYSAPTTTSPSSMEILSGLLLLAAIVIGLVSLALIPAVLVVRRQRPPLAFIVFACVVSIAPIVVMLFGR